MSTGTIPEAAARTGLKLARRIFEKRGNHTEAHVTEEELAVMLSAAFHLGTEHRDEAYPKLVEALRACAVEYVQHDATNGVHGPAHKAINLLRDLSEDQQ